MIFRQGLSRPLRGLLPGVLCSAVALAPAAGLAADDDAAAAILDRILATITTYSGSFRQQLLDEFGELQEESSGTVYLQRPGRFHWAYMEPYSQYLVSDGASVWIYDVDLEQVTIQNAVDMIDDTPAAVLVGEAASDSHYLVMEEPEHEGVTWFELTPRGIDAQYARIRLGFRDGMPAAMELHDSFGQTTRIAFAGGKVNGALDSDLFRFRVPDSVDVIDNRDRVTNPGER